jgi:hypothetical protein
MTTETPKKLSEYAKARARGKCPGCWKRPPLPGKAMCERCHESRKKAQKKYYSKHRAKMQAYYRAYKLRKRAERMAEYDAAPPELPYGQTDPTPAPAAS